jgi:DNA (cytosine-5)-methyltransferase 1
MSGLIVDLFAGGGGASAGIEAATGATVDIAINHSATALAVHKANHPGTRHLEADIWEVHPLKATSGRPVRLLWASPDCTQFSVAKGGKPRKQNIRSLAWAVVRWAKDVRPSVICLENVAEFRGWGPLDPEGKPIKARMGETFRRWKAQLERLGYVVDYRVLDASLYGAPTRRRRLFLVARCDGQPICWPDPTHGPGLLPVHTAAECIDWSLPCPSIFERKRPLAEKTLWRIAQGIRRFVLESTRPFIIRTDHHQSHATNAFDPAQPLGTITSANGHAVVAPHLVKVNHGKREARGEQLDLPLSTVTATQRGHALVTPLMVQVDHGDDARTGERFHSACQPLGVVTATGNSHAVIAPVLATIDQQGTGDRSSTSADAPLPTTVTKNRHVLIAPTMVQTSYGERKGQRPRYLDLHQPLGTVVAQGQKHALVSAFLAKHFGGVVGVPFDGRPLDTITSQDHHALAAVNLVKLRGQCNGAGVDEPMPTVTASGMHVAQVRAFLTAYYGEDGTSGQEVLEPMRTITAKHRLGLVTVEGTEYQIVDIGMRMLEPHELLRAQFGRFAASYDLSAATTKSAQVRLIGNSVCPEVAEAVVGANLPRGKARAAA